MTKSTSQRDQPRTHREVGKQPSGAKGSKSRNTILDTAEHLMIEQGYAAVSSRRVAREAGLKPSLIHYYFPTTDDLFVAVFRRAANREMEKLENTITETPSLEQLWASYCNQHQTVLAMEFMALANHRKAIREEIAAMTEHARRRRAEILSQLIDPNGLQPEGCSTLGLNVLLIGVARTLVMESSLGIDLGHDEAKLFVGWALRQLADNAP